MQVQSVVDEGVKHTTELTCLKDLNDWSILTLTQAHGLAVGLGKKQLQAETYGEVDTSVQPRLLTWGKEE